ncbi:MAG TPA: hypothetical protein VIM11_28115 [Tepidisphaeraceae bacterium]
MANIGGLYKVRGPNAVYYAVHDPATGRLWTERSEHSARAQAQEAGLELAPERSITHQALMQLSGRETTIPAGPSPARSNLPQSSQEPASSQTPAPPRSISSRAAFAPLDSDPPVLIKQNTQLGAVFSADAAVSPIESNTEDPSSPSAGAALNRDVLSEKRPMKSSGKDKNPFADAKPKRRK